MPLAMISSGDRVLSVESLTSEVARVAETIDFWKSVRLVAGILAILLAAVTAVAQWMEFKRSSELSARQAQLGKLKESERDAKLREINATATTAKQAAATANERTESLQKDTAEVKQRIARRHLTPEQRSLLVSLLASG